MIVSLLLSQSLPHDSVPAESLLVHDALGVAEPPLLLAAAPHLLELRPVQQCLVLPVGETAR